MSSPRLFAALPLPGEARRALARVAERLAAGAASGRPRLVPEEQIHLTLRFFGAGPDPGRMEERLRAALPDRSGPVRLVVNGLGAFPSSRRARVGFAAIAEVGGDRLRGLHAVCEQVARDAGLAAETRRFVPHVTLLRLRRRVALRESLLADAACAISRREIVVPELRLVASTLTPAGAVHRPVARFPFGSV